MESPCEYSYSYRESSYSLVSPIFTLDRIRVTGRFDFAALGSRQTVRDS